MTIIIIILVMTDIGSAVVLQPNDIKEISCCIEISCGIISAVEGKCPHLYFLQAKAFREWPENPSPQAQ